MYGYNPTFTRPASPGPLDSKGPLLVQDPPNALSPAGPVYNSSHPFYWWYGEKAGGFIFQSPGKREYGKRIRDVSIGYLDSQYHGDSCTCELDAAIRTYQTGLWNWVQDHFQDFVVVLGREHKGRKLYEIVDDEGWLEFLSSEKNSWLREHQGGWHPGDDWIPAYDSRGGKYRFFFAALDRFLTDPRGSHSISTWSSSQVEAALQPISASSQA
ncbi:hypothetical protein CC2G_012183 [Coprinopsis cinerea AmutBmut pab1-1]|nr:hypothetical protein CC2G_012183 [Coprinopsis cinerea AmutBmut pab1-1]